MLTWIKRAVRWPWFGARVGMTPVTFEHSWDEMRAAAYKRAIELKAAKEATIAQKNVRLASIARERDRLKDKIARLKRNKKRHSHVSAELQRLSTRELQIIYGKEPVMEGAK